MVDSHIIGWFFSSSNRSFILSILWGVYFIDNNKSIQNWLLMWNVNIMWCFISIRWFYTSYRYLSIGISFWSTVFDVCTCPFTFDDISPLRQMINAPLYVLIKNDHVYVWLPINRHGWVMLWLLASTINVTDIIEDISPMISFVENFRFPVLA